MPPDNTTISDDEKTLPGFGVCGENLSIMIPNYNGAKFIGETLASVWAQGEMVENSEICVMDNASSDTSEAIVKAMGKGRVTFFQHRQNIGAVRNFNACLERATRQWVHVLHSDDCVLTGGYAEADRILRENPDCDALMGRSVYIDEQSRWVGTTMMLGEEWGGVMVYDPVLWRVSPVQFVSAFLRQNVIKATGGFRRNENDTAWENSADWNLWWRVARQHKPAYTNACIGAYRSSSVSGTARTLRSGALLSDILLQLNELTVTLAPDEVAAAYAPMFDIYFPQMTQLLDDPIAFRTNMRLLDKFPKNTRQKARMARLQMNFMRHQMRRGTKEKAKQ